MRLYAAPHARRAMPFLVPIMPHADWCLQSGRFTSAGKALMYGCPQACQACGSNEWDDDQEDGYHCKGMIDDFTPCIVVTTNPKVKKVSTAPSRERERERETFFNAEILWVR